MRDYKPRDHKQSINAKRLKRTASHKRARRVKTPRLKIARAAATRPRFTFGYRSGYPRSTAKPLLPNLDYQPPVEHSPTKRALYKPAEHYKTGSANRSMIAVALGMIVCCTALAWPQNLSQLHTTREALWGIDQSTVRASLQKPLSLNSMPEAVRLNLKAIDGGEAQPITAKLHYNIDWKLQTAITNALRKYAPDYGALVVLNPRDGKVLAMTSFSRDGANTNLALQASFPAASVFKTITAASVIDSGKAHADSIIPYNGKGVSLYKTQVLRHKNNKWTKYASLRQSYAKSVNSVFARIGIYAVGGNTLLDYAERFKFNSALPSDLKIQPSRVTLDPKEEWSIAEVASGYTTATTISPIHAALLAATVVNDGIMVMPQLVSGITSEDGIPLYVAPAATAYSVIKPTTATEMRTLMQGTVQSGSASKQFRGFSQKFAGVEVGGKTGSLTGFEPRGKYDWFVGYARDGRHQIAFAALCINKKVWRVKASYLARKAIEEFFRNANA